MNICHITSVHKATDNRIFYKECISLKNFGFKVSLIAPGVHDHEKDDIKIYGIPANNRRIKRFFLTSFIHAYRKAKTINAEIFHFHDTELIPIGILLKLSGKKVIYDIHENNPAALLSRPYLNNKTLKIILSKTIDIIEKIAVRFFDVIITARPDISKRFEKHKPFTLRNFPILPIYDEIPNINIEKKKHSVIYVGGMSKIRGILELITAFEQIDEAELWLLGGFESPEFEQECKNLKAWKNVKYFGSVEPYEIFSFIKQADIGIITFLPKPNHLTTLATKPFEYMACGLPLIMSNFEYWKNFFKESAFYVDPENSSDIADKIKLLLSDKNNLASMAKLNLSLAQNEYNWDKESKNLLDAYNSIKDKITN